MTAAGKNCPAKAHEQEHRRIRYPDGRFHPEQYVGEHFKAIRFVTRFLDFVCVCGYHQG